MAFYHSDFHHSSGANNPEALRATTRARRERQFSLNPPAPDLDYEQISRATERSRESLSKTTAKVVHLLLTGDLSRMRSETIADELGISPTTLRRRLRADNISYQELLDMVRQHRCEKQLNQRWVPGKTLAWDLGYAEVNSFYRAFRRWTGLSYSEIKLQYV